MANPPQMLNVHKTHFLLAKLGADAFATEVWAELAASQDQGVLDLPPRAGIYRYDVPKDLDVKRLFNYELPFAVADAVLSRLFGRHIGDPMAFAHDLYLTPAMITEMAAGGMAFGWHTQNHCVLSRTPATAQRRELAAGVETIRQLTGQVGIPFCYPYGHPHTYTGETLAILADCGYASAFTVVRRFVLPERDHRYELPRFDTRDLPPFGGLLPHA